jgi:cyclic nucleotide gated channel
MEDGLYYEERRFQAAIVSDGSSSRSLGAALYAAHFACNSSPWKGVEYGSSF